jgi:pimeloyl-ACP methyl ester carboxylesterase
VPETSYAPCGDLSLAYQVFGRGPDAAGFEAAALFGVSAGSPASIIFAATRPERTRAPILTGTAAYSATKGWEDLDRDPAELRARVIGELGEKYTSSIETIARMQQFGKAVFEKWGSHDATLGSCGGGDGQEDTMDTSWHVSHRPRRQTGQP